MNKLKLCWTVIKNFTNQFLLIPFIIGTIIYLVYKKFGGCSYVLDLVLAFCWWMSLNYVAWTVVDVDKKLHRK